MRYLLAILCVAFFIAFIICIYFMIQESRGKQPIWKMWVCIVAMWGLNIGIHIVNKIRI